MPRLIQVIESEIPRGAGTQEDPVRTVRQYHDVEGNFLAERDPAPPNLTVQEYLRRHTGNLTAEGPR